MSTDLHPLFVERRSIRHFTDQPLSSDEVATLMEAALRAPSSRGKHSTRYILCDDPEMLRQLSAVRGEASVFVGEAPLGIVLCGSPLHVAPYLEDAAIAATHIQLQATALGLGSCWCQIAHCESIEGGEASERIRQRLNIPYFYDVVCILAVGHPAEHPSPYAPETLLWERIHLQHFDAERPEDILS